ncbi:hypothetical protein [Streptomyces sp. NPDC053079]|uniref:hypothetical protein n=1 Tax=Streptomyces sp. NPDC053079 TaxID=3365697 RepID=UPI0037D1186D
MPSAPPGATNLPPWRTAAPPPVLPLAPPPPPPPPAPGVLEVRLVVDLVPVQEEKLRRDFSWFWRWLRPWQSLAWAAVVLIPSPAYGHSITTAWAATLHEARGFALPAAYCLAGGALALAVVIDAKWPTWWSRPLLIVTSIGGTGALGWYDLITLVTGVQP